MKKGLSVRRKARQTYKRVAKTSKVGSGKRFKALAKSVKAGGATNPNAVAASIGRKKYGKKRFQAMAAKGKRKKR